MTHKNCNCHQIITAVAGTRYTDQTLPPQSSNSFAGTGMHLRVAPSELFKCGKPSFLGARAPTYTHWGADTLRRFRNVQGLRPTEITQVHQLPGDTHLAGILGSMRTEKASPNCDFGEHSCECGEVLVQQRRSPSPRASAVGKGDDGTRLLLLS